MPRNILLVLGLVLPTTGCTSESPDARLPQVPQQALAEQAAQNKRMAELEKQVQEHSADVDRQRDALEQQRQELAAARIREPLLAHPPQNRATPPGAPPPP